MGKGGQTPAQAPAMVGTAESRGQGMTRCIAVVSIGRSGSSALAGALHQAGISFGDERELIGPHEEFNPKGHFEMASWRRRGSIQGCGTGRITGVTNE